MEQAQNSPSGSRRSEDIALDLLKFVSSVAGVGRSTTPVDRLHRANRARSRKTRSPNSSSFTPAACAPLRVRSNRRLVSPHSSSPNSLAQPRLRVAVFGAGAFGRNHLRVYRELEKAGHPVILAAVIDSDASHARRAADEWQIPAYTSVEEFAAAGEQVDAASVCVPTSAHFRVASNLAGEGN